MGIRVFICSTLFSVAAAASLFAQNQPPSADPQTVFTNGAEPIEIVLRGSDPEGRDLRFEIVEPPRFGEISEPEPIVPPEEIDPRTGEPYTPPITSARVRYSPRELRPDSFTFSVTDEEGASGVATVAINPPTEEPPPPPAETVIAIDRTVEAYADRETIIKLLGDAPEGVSLTFDIASQPQFGELGELVQGSEEPRRSATVLYVPERGFTGEDSFAFKVCGGDQCDDGVMRINVVEPAASEPFTLASDINVKTFVDQPVTFTLASDNRPRLQGEAFIFNARVTGNVADSDEDERGDNASVEFMRAGVHLDEGEGATGTARAHMEWDLRELAELAEKFEIERADVRVQTLRREKEGVNTFFHWVTSDGDGELAPSDFESDAEAIPGAILPMPSLEQMPVGSEGTFSFSVQGELEDALRSGFRIFSAQARVKENERERAAGLDLRKPELIVQTSRPAPELTYTVKSLPEGGVLRDNLGNEIREVPHVLPDPRVTFTPIERFIGEATFQFEVSDSIRFDIATVIIKILAGRCQDDARFCNNGR